MARPLLPCATIDSRAVNRNGIHGVGGRSRLSGMSCTVVLGSPPPRSRSPAPMRFPAAAQPIRLGELNSYKVFPAFLEPYRKGMELAQAEINAAGGVLGRPLEIVFRDDNGTPGDAVRVAGGVARARKGVAS